MKYVLRAKLVVTIFRNNFIYRVMKRTDRTPKELS